MRKPDQAKNPKTPGFVKAGVSQNKTPKKAGHKCIG
jgi:hypothetical protein